MEVKDRGTGRVKDETLRQPSAEIYHPLIKEGMDIHGRRWVLSMDSYDRMMEVLEDEF